MLFIPLKNAIFAQLCKTEVKMKYFFAGELLMRLDCENLDRFEQTDHFLCRYTGAEANAAVALCSLGETDVELLSAVPDHAIGRSCLNFLHQFGPEVRHVLKRTGRLGVMFLETGAYLRPSQVIYDRADSVFAKTPYEAYDFPALFRRNAGAHLHFSGTLPALSGNTRDLAEKMIREAHRCHLTVSMDLNYRSALWSLDEAKACFQSLAENTDILISNAQVAESFLETPETDLCRRFHFKAAALTRRQEPDASHTAFSGTLYTADGNRADAPERTFRVLDRVGGGDAFAGAILYAMNQPDWDLTRKIDFAAACSALKHATRGDFSLSTFDEVEALRCGEKLSIRR